MARVPEIIRREPISQVAAAPAPGGAGWAALGEMAKMGADFVKPAALEAATNKGLSDVYRDADGTLKVAKWNVLGGEMADAHNSAAYAKYLGQRRIDMAQSFTELAQKYQYDPAGFKQASDAYIQIMQQDETVPPTLREELLQSAQQEGNQRFNGLYQNQTARTENSADKNTLALRNMLADDYANLMVAGDTKGAEAKMTEIEGLSSYRANAPYIAETPAQTDGYLRGVRASAKVAVLMKQLGTLGDMSAVPAGVQTQIDAVLKDPDLDPKQRQTLLDMSNGALKGVAANAFVQGTTATDYAAKVAKVEGGNNPNAANPNSTAVGLHQFIAGTWMENVHELQSMGGAKWADGLSPAEILAKRTDPAISGEVFQHFTEKNQAVLKANGIPVNDATTYMAHFLGAGGAVQVLSADPNALVKDILGWNEKTASANPSQANMTAGQLMAWAERKMTVKASDMAQGFAAVNQIPDAETRKMAHDALMAKYGIQSQLETVEYQTVKDQLESPGSDVTEAQIRSNSKLSDEAQNQLSAELGKQREASAQAAAVMSSLNNGGHIDGSDPSQVKGLDTAFTGSLNGAPALSPQGQGLAATLTVQGGLIPESFYKAGLASVRGNDPQALGSFMEWLGPVLKAQPGALTGMPNAKEVTDALADYQHFGQYQTQAEVTAKMIEQRTPEFVAKAKNLTDVAKKSADTLKPKDVLDFFSASQTGELVPGPDGKNRPVGKASTPGVLDPGTSATIMTDFKDLYQQAYVETNGDAGQAKTRALNELARVWGPDMATGKGSMMKYPPQLYYPQSNARPNWMRDQLVADVSEWNGTMQTFHGPHGGSTTVQTKIPATQIIITSDVNTAAEIAAGKPPTYAVSYLDQDGMMQSIPERYGFQPANAQQADAQARLAAGQKIEADQKAANALQQKTRDQIANEFQPYDAMAGQ